MSRYVGVTKTVGPQVPSVVFAKFDCPISYHVSVYMQGISRNLGAFGPPLLKLGRIVGLLETRPSATWFVVANMVKRLSHIIRITYLLTRIDRVVICNYDP